MDELGRRARAATPEEAARAGDRVVVSIPPALPGASRPRTVGQGPARHRGVHDAPYDEPDDGRVEPHHVVGDHQQHALGGPGQRTTSRLSGRRRRPGRNGMSRKTGSCMQGAGPARPPRLSVLSGAGSSTGCFRVPTRTARHSDCVRAPPARQACPLEGPWAALLIPRVQPVSRIRSPGLAHAPRRNLTPTTTEPNSRAADSVRSGTVDDPTGQIERFGRSETC